MATGGSGSSTLPDPTGRGGRGEPSGGGRGRSTDADADADRMEYAPGIQEQAPPDRTTLAASAPKEGSARSKKLAKKSSRTILADALENTAIGTDPSVSGNDGNDSLIDEVFSPGQVPSGDPGSNRGADDAADFPPDYNVIRTAKSAGLAPTRLGGLFGLGRHATGTRLGYGPGGLAVAGDCRTFSAQNYHCAEKGLNMSFSIARPDHSGNDGLQCLACPIRHSHADRMAGEGRPVVIILADQNFPPILPAGDGDCVMIVRVEDGTLSELDTVFTERFRAFLKPHGNLTPGSVVLVGSLSFLRACGIQEYAENLVRTIVSISNKTGGGVDVLPLVGVPMHGLESASLIRNLMDLDAWLLAVQGGGRTALPKSRETFWGVLTEGVGGTKVQTDSYTFMMPIGIRNHRKHPVVSDPYDGLLPTSIPPASSAIEQRIITALFTELNDVYGLALDVNPDISREPIPIAGNGQTRLICVGASHMARLSGAAAAIGVDSIWVGLPGGIASRDSLADAARKLASLAPQETDTVMLDLFSNSAFMGTDDSGLPCRATKGFTDSRYHIQGELQAAPRSIFEKIIKDAEATLNTVSGCKLILVSPFPRYIAGKCCTDSTHIANWGSESLVAECRLAGEMAERAFGTLSGITQFSLLSFFEIFDSADPNLTEVRTSAGKPVWLPSDPVHLSEHAYAEMAASALERQLPEDGEPRPGKRIRLESVVPAPPRGARGHQGRIRPPLWVSGMASGRGAGGRPRARGGVRGGTRGPAGNWGVRFRGRGAWGGYGSGRNGFQRGFRGRGRY